MSKKSGDKFVTRVCLILESVSKSTFHGSESGCVKGTYGQTIVDDIPDLTNLYVFKSTISILNHTELSY